MNRSTAANRRWRVGLTLIEVLASIVLLTLIAATCTSLLRGAAHQANATTSLGSLSVEELGLVADSVIADPAAHGIESLAEVTERSLHFDDETGLLPAATIRLRRVESSDADAAYFWLVFSIESAAMSGDSACVTRWVLKSIDKNEKTEHVP